MARIQGQSVRAERGLWYWQEYDMYHGVRFSAYKITCIVMSSDVLHDLHI